MQMTKQQQGMTAIGWLLVLVLVLVFAIIIIKLVPVYLDGFKVYSAMSSLEKDPKAMGKPPKEIRKLLMRRLDIDMVTDVGKDDVYFTRDRSGTTVEVDYEVRRKLFGNMYVVVVFNKSVVIPN